MAFNGTENKERHLFTILNTNARSICPKVGSFIDCYKEMDACLAVITETWLRDGQQLEDDVDDLLHGAGVGLITKNRLPNARGVAHGGVAIAFRDSVLAAKEISIDNPENYEVLAAVCTIGGHARKLICIAAYIPPNYTVARGRGCLEFLAEIVTNVKRKYREPCLLYTSPSPRDLSTSRMPSSA